jgi:hypothetical protein
MWTDDVCFNDLDETDVILSFFSFHGVTGWNTKGRRVYEIIGEYKLSLFGGNWVKITEL